MDDVVVYLTKEQLIEIAGREWEDAFKSLKAANVIDSYEFVLAVKVKKSKAIHIQSILEFCD